MRLGRFTIAAIVISVQVLLVSAGVTTGPIGADDTALPPANLTARLARSGVTPDWDAPAGAGPIWPPVAQTVDICGRTAQVEAAILATGAVTTSDCSLVPASELASVRRLDLDNQSIASLQAGDFAGLTSLRKLVLEDNELTKLPADVFDGLTSLTLLDLCANPLESLPPGVFDQLTSLKKLDLYVIPLESLPPGVFDQLSSLEELLLYNNFFVEELPAGVFDNLTNLKSLKLSANPLGELSPDMFDQLTSLETLDLRSTSLRELPPGVFDKLTSLVRLDLDDNLLGELPPGVFDHLTSLTWLDLRTYWGLSYSPYLLSPLASLETLDDENYTRPAVPGAPTGLTATFTARDIGLGWTAPADGGAPTSYQILCQEGSSAEKVCIHDTYARGPVAVTCTYTYTYTYTYTDVTEGKAYRYRVKALNAGGASPGSAPADALNDEKAVTLSFELGSDTVAEGSSVTVKVKLDADPERTVTIPVTATNRDGATSADYRGAPTSVAFNSGDTEQTFTFAAVQDSVDDDDESVKLGFGALPTGVSAGTTAETTVSIIDDDTAGVTVPPTRLTVDEGGDGTYTVVLDSQPTHTVTVTVNDPADNTDVAAGPPSLAFTTSNWSNSQNVTVSSAQDLRFRRRDRHRYPHGEQHRWQLQRHIGGRCGRVGDRCREHHARDYQPGTVHG